MEEQEIRWGIGTVKTSFAEIKKYGWGVGLNFSNYHGQHYIHINLGFIGISIGKLYLKVRK